MGGPPGQNEMIETDCNSAKKANFRHTFNLPPKINGKRLSRRRSVMRTDPTAEVSSVVVSGVCRVGCFGEEKQRGLPGVLV